MGPRKTTPPLLPLTLTEDAFEERPAWMLELEKDIHDGSVRTEPVLRHMAELMKAQRDALFQIRDEVALARSAAGRAAHERLRRDAGASTREVGHEGR